MNAWRITGLKIHFIHLGNKKIYTISLPQNAINFIILSFSCQIINFSQTIWQNLNTHPVRIKVRKLQPEQIYSADSTGGACTEMTHGRKALHAREYLKIISGFFVINTNLTCNCLLSDDMYSNWQKVKSETYTIETHAINIKIPWPQGLHTQEN